MNDHNFVYDFYYNPKTLYAIHTLKMSNTDEILKKTDDVIHCNNCDSDIIILNKTDAMKTDYYDNSHFITSKTAYQGLSGVGLAAFGGFPAYFISDFIRSRTFHRFPHQPFVQAFCVGPITVTIAAFCGGFGYSFLPLIVTRGGMRFYSSCESSG